MKLILNKNVWLFLALAYTISLLVASLVKIKSDSLPVNFTNADKIFHFGAYFAMTLIWNFYYYIRKKSAEKKPNLWICFAIIIFGIIVELLQRDMTTYRSFEWLDVVANSLGVIFGYIVLKISLPKLPFEFK